MDYCRQVWGIRTGILIPSLTLGCAVIGSLAFAPCKQENVFEAAAFYMTTEQLVQAPTNYLNVFSNVHEINKIIQAEVNNALSEAMPSMAWQANRPTVTVVPSLTHVKNTGSLSFRLTMNIKVQRI